VVVAWSLGALTGTSMCVCAICDGPTNLPAASVGPSTRRLMCKPMQFLQLNMQKRRGVQHSAMNDPGLKDYTALAISEPYVSEMDGKVRTSPVGHQSWMAILPSERHSGRWAVRSMLWVRKDIECEQVNVPSSDLTVVLLRLPDRSVLLASVHVEGANAAALERSGVADPRRNKHCAAPRWPAPRYRGCWRLQPSRPVVGDEVLPSRQGEADPIIDFMNKWGLESLLPRGTKTWQNASRATTIDLMLASQELASSVLKCKIHDTEHGSDHRAIETSFDVDVPDHAIQPRFLFKNAP
jgi:hypothetical protein